MGAGTRPPPRPGRGNPTRNTGSVCELNSKNADTGTSVLRRIDHLERVLVLAINTAKFETTMHFSAKYAKSLQN